VSNLKAARFHGAAAAAAVAVGLTVLAAAHSHRAAATRWVDRPAAIPAVSAAANPGLASCTSSELTVRMERHGLLGPGTYAYVYRATNHSAHACYVSGDPAVRIAGQAVARGPNVLNVTAGAVQPGASATFAVTQSPRVPCAAAAAAGPNGGPRAVARKPRVRIGAQPVAAAGEGTIMVTACTTTAVSPIGVSQAAPAPDPLAALTVRLNAPADTPAGQALHFTVTITNPGRAPVRLSPCPSYEVGVSAARPAAYQLNCSAPVIGPGRSRTFAMQYAVPAGTPAGLTKIGWFLLNPDRTGAGGFITITG
jgi:hypothetical protein